MQKHLRYTLLPVLLLCVIIVIASFWGYCNTMSELSKDYDFQTVTAYCDSYNAETGWFTLIDENGETWVFQDNGHYAIDREFSITYLDKDFELISLSNNGQTVEF